MRISLSALALSLCLSLGACNSGPAIDALKVPPPSNETTSSVVRPSVSMAIDEDAPPVRPNALAAAPRPSGPAQMQGGRIYGYSFGDADPVNFGPRKPQHLAVHGVDVSRWQGDIDWQKLRRYGANFAYIKATDGGDHLDPKFHENWRGAAAAGIRRGAYHFFYWCRTAASQAEWFIRNVPKEKGALPPVIDVEWNHQSSCKKRPPRSDVLDKIRVFSERLEQHYGQRPIIYTAPDFYEDNLKGAFLDHPFWLRAVAEHPSKVYPGRDWVFWQYSGTGLSSAVKGNIDLNVFAGDEDDWWRWVGKVSG